MRNPSERAFHIVSLDDRPQNTAEVSGTDTGVHALEDVVRCGLHIDWRPSALCNALNARFPANPAFGAS